MARKTRVVSGDRINFAGIYNGSDRSTNQSLFIEVTKDPYFVAIGGEETTGGHIVNPLTILDFCVVMALIFLFLFWESH